jgi:hypothetical protein
MATRKDVQAGAAYVTLFVKNSAFVKGLRDAEKQFAQMGQGLKQLGAKFLALGAAIQVPVTAALAQFGKVGTSLDRVADRLKVTTAEMSALGYAAQTVGGDVGTIEQAITALRERMAGAQLMDPAALQSLGVLQLTLQDLQGLPAAEQIGKVANQISRIQDPALQARRAVELLGGAGETLLPILRQGAVGFINLTNEAKRVGAVMRDEDAKAAREMAREFAKLSASAESVYRQIAVALAPAATELLQIIQPFVKSLADWIRKNKDVVVTIAKIGAASLAVGAALAGAGIVLVKVAALVGGLATAAIAATGAIGGLISALSTNIGKVIAVWLALGGADKAWQGVKRSAGGAMETMRTGLARVGQLVAPLVNDLRMAGRSIIEAIKAGNVDEAVEVLKAAFGAVVAQIKIWFFDAFDAVKDSTLDAFTFLRNTATQALAAVTNILSDFAEKPLESLGAGFKSLWEGLKDGALEVFNYIRQRIIETGKSAAELLSAAPGTAELQRSISLSLRMAQINLNRDKQELQSRRDQRAQEQRDRDQERADRKADAEAEVKIRSGENEINKNLRWIESQRRNEQLQEELDAARKRLGRAVYEARQADKNKVPELLQAQGKPLEALGVRSVIGTFSAQAATLLSGARETKLERIAAKQVKVGETQLQKLDRQIEKLDKLQQFLAVS